jgi:hypothetical protein
MNVPETQLPKEKLAEFYDIAKEMRLFQKKPVLEKCMFWSGDCVSPPIGSHLLARSWLEQIADNTNHVVRFVMATENLGNQPAQISARRVGVNVATTFPGFCEKHDNEMFSCLEKSPFIASREQLIALRYRSVCREACIKHQMVGFSLPRALAENVPPSFSMHVAAEFKRCISLLAEKQTLEKTMLNSGNSIDSYVVKFAIKPSVLVSATIYPLVSFTGRVFEFRQEWMTISIIPAEVGGWAIISWPKNAPKNSSLFAKSFAKIPKENQTVALLNFIFEASENHAISPAWWASLTNSQQHNLIKRFGRSFAVTGDNRPPANTLLVSEKSWVDWQPISAGYV